MPAIHAVQIEVPLIFTKPYPARLYIWKVRNLSSFRLICKTYQFVITPVVGEQAAAFEVIQLTQVEFPVLQLPAEQEVP